MTQTSAQYEYDIDNPIIYNNEMGRYKTERQLRFIRRFLSRNEMAVLDIGGGGGRIAIPLAQLGHHVTVTDTSKEALDKVRERSGGAIEVIHGDVLSLDLSRRFDAVMTIDMLKYVRSASLADIFSRVNSLVEMKGLYLIAEINSNSWRNRMSKLLGRRDFQPYNIGSSNEYREALERAGFEVEAMAGFCWMPLAFNSNSRLTRVFARAEDALQLDRWASQSPWLLIAARKVRAAPKQ